MSSKGVVQPASFSIVTLSRALPGVASAPRHGYVKFASIRITKDVYGHLLGAQRKHAAEAMGGRCGELSMRSETWWLPGLAANGAGCQVSDCRYSL